MEENSTKKSVNNAPEKEPIRSSTPESNDGNSQSAAVASAQNPAAKPSPAQVDYETLLKEKDAELLMLKGEIVELNGIKNRYGNAIGMVRSLLVQANPEVPEELLKGESVEELQTSLDSGKKLVARVLEKAAAKGNGVGAQHDVPIPAGAPVRSGIDLSGLSPKEKILYGLKIR